VLQRVCIEVSWGRAIVGAEVWEEAEGVDVPKDITVDDRQWYLLLSKLRAWAELGDIQEDLT